MNQRQLNTLIELCNQYKTTFMVSYAHVGLQVVLSGDVTRILRAIHENEAFKVIPDRERVLQLEATSEGLVIS